jgi:hypothetical protein
MLPDVISLDGAQLKQSSRPWPPGSGRSNAVSRGTPSNDPSSGSVGAIRRDRSLPKGMGASRLNTNRPRW